MPPMLGEEPTFALGEKVEVRVAGRLVLRSVRPSVRPSLDHVSRKPTNLSRSRAGTAGIWRK